VDIQVRLGLTVNLDILVGLDGVVGQVLVDILDLLVNLDNLV
jgi:hypothetical protein